MFNALTAYPVYFLWLPLLAAVLDLLLGDPAFIPHPVRGIGLLLNKLQPVFMPYKNKHLGGLLAICSAVAIVVLLVFMLTLLPFFGLFFMVYLSYAGLALGCLLREGRKALKAIESGNLEQGRAAVAMLVSRDVSALNQTGLYRTLAETLSENFTDAFVAPLFWLLLGGPAGLWAYKTISTADSMWGYRHEPWACFGTAVAKLDDFCAFIPARLSIVFLYMAAPSKNLWPGWRTVMADAKKMESPNAGWSMASAAWLHNACMGGPAVYAGVIKNKPVLGPLNTEWNAQKISKLILHINRAGLCALLCLWCIAALLHVLASF